MLTTSFGYKGAFTAPHRIAALAGQSVLAEGGTAVEAMVTAAIAPRGGMTLQSRS